MNKVELIVNKNIEPELSFRNLKNGEAYVVVAGHTLGRPTIAFRACREVVFPETRSWSAVTEDYKFRKLRKGESFTVVGTGE